jgi:hypothetical protein
LIFSNLSANEGLLPSKCWNAFILKGLASIFQSYREPFDCAPYFVPINDIGTMQGKQGRPCTGMTKGGVREWAVVQHQGGMQDIIWRETAKKLNSMR